MYHPCFLLVRIIRFSVFVSPIPSHNSSLFSYRKISATRVVAKDTSSLILPGKQTKVACVKKRGNLRLPLSIRFVEDRRTSLVETKVAFRRFSFSLSLSFWQGSPEPDPQPYFLNEKPVGPVSPKNRPVSKPFHDVPRGKISATGLSSRATVHGKRSQAQLLSPFTQADVSFFESTFRSFFRPLDPQIFTAGSRVV